MKGMKLSLINIPEGITQSHLIDLDNISEKVSKLTKVSKDTIFQILLLSSLVQLQDFSDTKKQMKSHKPSDYYKFIVPLLGSVDYHYLGNSDKELYAKYDFKSSDYLNNEILKSVNDRNNDPLIKLFKESLDDQEEVSMNKIIKLVSGVSIEDLMREHNL